jgi:acyl-CoA synthetase (AMP-forming)/AMP-acid ligase II
MLWKSPYADANIPEAPLTSVVLERAAALGDKPALVEGATGRSITYAELTEGVRRVARGLADRHFAPGDVLGLYSPNLPEYALAVFGVASLGGTVTPVNPLYTVDELAHQLEDAGARVLVTAPPFLEKARAAASRTGVKEVFVFGEADGALPFASLFRSVGEPPAVRIAPREQVAVLPYSSGTTGLPKGVMLTHHNLVSNIFQCADIEELRESDVVIAVLPFFHIYGLSVLLNMMLHHGCTLVTLPRFELEEFLRVLQDHKVSRAYLVPPIVLGLAKHPAVDKFDLRSLRCINSGAAPLGADVQRAVEKRLGCIVKQGYGLTETSPVTHMSPDDRVRLGASGLLIRNTECRIVEPVSHADLAAGERGELWVRGPQVMKGYLNNPERHARDDHDRRVAPNGRHRLRRCRRVPVRGGQAQGADQVQGHASGAGRAGGAPPDAPRGGGCGRDRQPGPGSRRGAEGVRGLEGRGHARCADGVRRGARRPAQEDPQARDRGADPQVAFGQDPAAAARGKGAEGGCAPVMIETRQSRSSPPLAVSLSQGRRLASRGRAALPQAASGKPKAERHPAARL